MRRFGGPNEGEYGALAGLSKTERRLIDGDGLAWLVDRDQDERDIRQAVMATHPKLTKAQRRRAHQHQVGNRLAEKRWYTHREEDGE